MILLKEEVNNIECIVESVGGQKNYYIVGPYIQPGIKNGNGRVYPEAIIEREVEKYTNKYIKENRAFGELGHPDGPKINLDRVSHIIKSLKKEGRDYYGKAKVMDTPYGKIVKNFLDEGAKIGMSTRGVGTVTTRNGVSYVNEDYHLCTAGDIVSDPSGPDCYVTGLMENANWVWDETNGWKTNVVLEDQKAFVSNNYRTLTEVKKFELLGSFLKTLSSK